MLPLSSSYDAWMLGIKHVIWKDQDPERPELFYVNILQGTFLNCIDDCSVRLA